MVNKEVKGHMKQKLIFIIALLCTVVQTAWGQTEVITEVGTEEALKAAVSNGGNIKMTIDIRLNSPLTITSGKTVTLDVNNHELSRSLSAAAANGNVIRVEEGGTLTIKDSSNGDFGYITGGWAERGGGIYNEGTLKIEGGNVNTNKSSYEGGGIWNKGTLYITGGEIGWNEAPRRVASTISAQ